jgi:hypothetical protein
MAISAVSSRDCAGAPSTSAKKAWSPAYQSPYSAAASSEK